MSVVAAILFPIIFVMEQILSRLHALSGSYGIAIVVLSLLVRALTAPITRIATRAEERERQVQLAMAPELDRARRESTGRARFERIEAIYAAHNYHPIKSVVSLLPIGLQLPFLLSALFLLVDNAALAGENFLIVRDLGRPDGLLPLAPFLPGVAINVLPLLITAVALGESLIRPKATRAARVRFFAISIVIAVLIYPLPAAVCLYWLTSNLASLGVTIFQRMSAAQADRRAEQ